MVDSSSSPLQAQPGTREGDFARIDSRRSKLPSQETTSPSRERPKPDDSKNCACRPNEIGHVTLAESSAATLKLKSALSSLFQHVLRPTWRLPGQGCANVCFAREVGCEASSHMTSFLTYLILLVSILTILTSCTHKSPLPLISITQIATNPGIDAIRSGFIDEMGRLGYKEGQSIRYDLSNAQGDIATAQTIAQKMVSDSPRIIFAISTPSSQTVAQAIKGTNIPLVFGAVTDPIAAGLVESMDKPGRNITGTSDKWPVKDQFALLLRLKPSVKRIGLVFNPGEANAQSNVDVVERVTKELHLTLVKVPVSNTGEVQTAAASLVGRCDAFYVPADNTVIDAMDAMVRVSEQNKIPLLPGVSSGVQQGGFGTLGPDYYDVGVQSARLADQILRGRSAGSIPVATATRFEYFFNVRSAKATGVNIPSDLLKQAAKVYP